MRARSRRRWGLVLLAGVGILAIYYSLAVGSLRGHDASAVRLDDRGLEHPRSRVTLQIEAADLDTGSGSFDFQLRPVPMGRYESDLVGQLDRPLQVVVSSPGQPPQTFDFAKDQLVDPVAVSVGAVTRASGFPFDRPRSSFALAARSRDEPVPVDLEMVDETEGWNLSADTSTERSGRVQLDLLARRETLAISLAIFYIAGIAVVALITVAVIGGALVRGVVGFDQVIWLGAMLVAIPAVRNEMPGVPPVGTAVDLFVFFPSIVVVGVALLAGVVVLALTEAAAARSPSPEPADADDDRVVDEPMVLSASADAD